MEQTDKKPVDQALLDRLARMRAAKAEKARQLAEKKAAAAGILTPETTPVQTDQPVETPEEQTIEVPREQIITEQPKLPEEQLPVSVPVKKLKRTKKAAINLDTIFQKKDGESSTDSSDTSDSEDEEPKKRRNDKSHPKWNVEELKERFQVELEKAKNKYRERYRNRYSSKTEKHVPVAEIPPPPAAPQKQKQVIQQKQVVPQQTSHFRQAVDRSILEAAIKDILRL